MGEPVPGYLPITSGGPATPANGASDGSVPSFAQIEGTSPHVNIQDMVASKRAQQGDNNSKVPANCQGQANCGSTAAQGWAGVKDFASDAWSGLKSTGKGLAAVGAVLAAHSHSDDPEENQEDQSTPEYQQNLQDAKTFLGDEAKGLGKTALMLTGPGAIYFTYKSIKSGKMHDEYEKGGGGLPGVARAAGYAGAEGVTAVGTAAAGGVAGRVLGGGVEAGAVGAEAGGSADGAVAGTAAGADAATAGEPISVATGEYLETWRDFLVPAALPFNGGRYMGLKLPLCKDYASPLGPCQISDFDEIVSNPERGLLDFHQADGKVVRFDRPFNFLPSTNAAYPHLEVRTPWLRRLELRDRALIKHLRQYEDGIYRLEKIEDTNGNALTFTRTEEGVLERVDSLDGLALVFTSGAHSRRTSITLVGVDGSRLLLARYAYDARGRMSEADCSHGMSVRYVWHPERDLLLSWHNITRRSETHFTYDEAGRVIHTRTNGLWNDDRFRYDPVNRETTYLPSDDARLAQRFRYDENDNVTHEIDALGGVLQHTFDTAGFETATTDANGHVTNMAYDSRGNVKRHVDAEGRGTTYGWGPHGELDIVIDGAGRIRKYDNDEKGNCLAETDAEGNQTRYVRDDRGRLLCTVYPDGAQESRSYDAHGRLVAITDARDGTTAYEHDPFGRVVAVIDALGGVTRYEYAAGAGGFGTPTALIRPDSVRITRAYSADGVLASVSDGEGRRWTYSYGAFDVLQAIEDPGGGRLSFAYDGEGRVTGVTNQKGLTYALIRDAAGRVVAEEDFDGRRTAYARDPGGRVTQTTKPDGVRLAYTYDRADKLTSIKGYAADDPGKTRPLDETHFWYDERGLLVRASNLAALVAFERDGNGRVVAEITNGRKIASTLDARGRRVERHIGHAQAGEGQAGEGLVRYAHDPLGMVASIAIDDHPPLAFTRDALGRETRRASATGYRLEQSWDPVGQLLTQDAGHGPSALDGLHAAMAAPSPDSGAHRHYRWDKAGAPTGIDDALWGETRYRYDANGQVAEASFGDGFSERFDYDAAKNVVGVKVEGPQVGPGIGGLLAWRSTPGGVVQLARGPNGESIALTHDVCGRVVERRVDRKGFRPKTWAYGWDAHDRLVRCDNPEGETWFYRYDPFGRRLTKVRKLAERELAWTAGKFPQLVPAAAREATKLWTWPEPPLGSGGPGKTRPPVVGKHFSWDGDVVADEASLRLDGTVDWVEATRWHYEPAGFRPLAKQTPDGQLLPIVTDHLGTPREMFDEAGHLCWAASFTSWGGVRGVKVPPKSANDDGAAIYPRGDSANGNLLLRLTPDEAACPIKFLNQWTDDETGLNYNRNRHYDSLAAQYASPDPIGLGGGDRPQGYVQNPIVWTDPLGLAATSGETGATAYGRLMHQQHDFGPGFDTEVTIGGGNRVDAIKIEGNKATIKELKPDNKRQRAAGLRQLERYKQQLLDSNPNITNVDTVLETYPPYVGK